MTWFMRYLVFFPVCLFFTAISFAAEEPVSKSFLSGVAIKGHDSVAYHSPAAIESHQQVKGSKRYTVKYKDAKWHFADQASVDLFKANPQKYSPAFNGHCANALSLGEGLVKTDGSHWQIFDDQLYLFYAAKGRERWLKGNFSEYKMVADSAWEEILNH